MTYGETSPGLNTVTLPPVIGKISEPDSSFAVPTTPGVSSRLVRASVKPWSRAIAVVSPCSASMEATGFGADVDELDDDAVEESLSELLHAASGVATSAAMARAASERLAVNFLVVLMMEPILR